MATALKYGAYTWVVLNIEKEKIVVRQAATSAKTGYTQFIDPAGNSLFLKPVTAPALLHFPTSGGQAYQDLTGRIIWTTSTAAPVA